ncbi:MAG: sodium:solute symporter [Bacillota bacterium]
MGVTWLDYTVIVLYFAFMLAIGYWGMKLSKTLDDYLVAGRRLRTPFYMACLATVVLGGASTLGSAKLGYKFGISGFWLVFMLSFGVLVMGFLLSSRISALRLTSVCQMLERRYCSGARYLSAVIMVVYDMLVVTVQVISIGTIISAIFGWNLTASMLVGGAIVLAYTTSGGMWAVSITDAVQFTFMTIGIFFLALPLGLAKVGGWAALTAKLEPHYFSLTNIGGKTILAYFLLFFFGIIIGQDIWQRVFTARNPRVARTGTILAGLYGIFYGVAMAIIGMVALVLFPKLPDPQYALPMVAIHALPPGATGILLAAAISALMSTADGCMLASSTVLVTDLILPLSRRQFTDQDKQRLVRLFTFLAGLVAIVCAVWIQDILAALDLAYALLSGAIVVPIVAGFYWKRATWQGAMWAIGLGSLAVIVGLAREGLSATNPIIYGIITSIVVLVAASLLTRPDPQRLQTWEETISHAHEQV